MKDFDECLTIEEKKDLLFHKLVQFFIKSEENRLVQIWGNDWRCNTAEAIHREVDPEIQDLKDLFELAKGDDWNAENAIEKLCNLL
jgi:hypothetical protein